MVAVERDEQLREVDAPNDQANGRHHDVFDEGVDDLAKCSRRSRPDGQIDHVSANHELFEVLKHESLLSARRVGVVHAFVCALMFWIEPMVGKQLLPLVGGAPAVWNVCLLFFQSALLAGYAFAHAVTRLRRPGLQVFLYLALVGSALLTWPIHFDTPPPLTNPSFWLLGQLLSVLACSS